MMYPKSTPAVHITKLCNSKRCALRRSNLHEYRVFGQLQMTEVNPHRHRFPLISFQHRVRARSTLRRRVVLAPCISPKLTIAIIPPGQDLISMRECNTMSTTSCQLDYPHNFLRQEGVKGRLRNIGLGMAQTELTAGVCTEDIDRACGVWGVVNYQGAYFSKMIISSLADYALGDQEGVTYALVADHLRLMRHLDLA
ncbi:hypothetical protein BJX76DRAFT_165078 [Aspergillus varians]